MISFSGCTWATLEIIWPSQYSSAGAEMEIDLHMLRLERGWGCAFCGYQSASTAAKVDVRRHIRRQHFGLTGRWYIASSTNLHQFSHDRIWGGNLEPHGETVQGLVLCSLRLPFHKHSIKVPRQAAHWNPPHGRLHSYRRANVKLCQNLVKYENTTFENLLFLFCFAQEAWRRLCFSTCIGRWRVGAARCAATIPPPQPRRATLRSTCGISTCGISSPRKR